MSAFRFASVVYSFLLGSLLLAASGCSDDALTVTESGKTVTPLKKGAYLVFSKYVPDSTQPYATVNLTVDSVYPSYGGKQNVVHLTNGQFIAYEENGDVSVPDSAAAGPGVHWMTLPVFSMATMDLVPAIDSTSGTYRAVQHRRLTYGGITSMAEREWLLQKAEYERVDYQAVNGQAVTDDVDRKTYLYAPALGFFTSITFYSKTLRFGSRTSTITWVLTYYKL